MIAAGHLREIDVGEVNDKRFLCIASCGFDSDANRIANEAKRVKGQAVYLYAALRALWEWKPARFTLTFDGRAARSSPATRWPPGTAAPTAEACSPPPNALLDDGLLDVVWSEQTSKRRFLSGILPKVFKGTHVEQARGRRQTGRRTSASRPTAPSPSTPTATTSPICRPRCGFCERRCG